MQVDHKERRYSKKLLLESIQKESGYNMEIVKKVFDTTFAVITQKIMEGKTVNVPGFGSWKLLKMEYKGKRRISYHRVQELDIKTGRVNKDDDDLKVSYVQGAGDMTRRVDKKIRKDGIHRTVTFMAEQDEDRREVRNLKRKIQKQGTLDALLIAERDFANVFGDSEEEMDE